MNIQQSFQPDKSSLFTAVAYCYSCCYSDIYTNNTCWYPPVRACYITIGQQMWPITGHIHGWSACEWPWCRCRIYFRISFLNPVKLSNVYFCFMAVMLMFFLIVCMCKLFVIWWLLVKVSLIKQVSLKRGIHCFVDCLWWGWSKFELIKIIINYYFNKLKLA